MQIGLSDEGQKSNSISLIVAPSSGTYPLLLVIGRLFILSSIRV